MYAPLSFIVPAYNCAATLAQSIHSIVQGNLRQQDEIVLVDDGSSDATAAVAQSLAAEHPAIRIYSHARNKGGGAARNHAVENARHDLIFCLDSDNLLPAGALDPLRAFRETEQADVVSFRESRMFKTAPTEPTLIWRYRPGVLTLADYLAGIVVPGASGNYLFTRASWLRAGGYPEYSGALDTWGFGLRQVATGQRMVVMPTGYYQHRHGHASYWTRENVKGKTSLIALQLLIPFLDQIVDEDVDYVMGREGRMVWHGQLDRHPLRVRNGPLGRAGYILDSAGVLLPFFADLVHDDAPEPPGIQSAADAVRHIFQRAYQGVLGQADYVAALGVIEASGNIDLAQALRQAWAQGNSQI